MSRQIFIARPVSRGPILHTAGLALILVIAALVATVSIFSRYVTLENFLQALFDPNLDSLDEIVVYYSLLPRLVISLLCGAGLGIAGAVFQQVLRNPLAEPTTIGVSAGAQLALTLVTLFMPSLSAIGTESIAIAGAMTAALLIGLLAWKQGLSPSGLVISGLMISLYAGSFASVLAQLFGENLGSVFIWSTGSLSQNDWSAVHYLLPRLAITSILIAFLVRPLTIIGLDDQNARNLGLSLPAIRLLAFLPTVAICAFVVSSVGVLGFIGLAAPALAKLSGARQFNTQIIWSAILGAVLLWLTDEAVQLLAMAGLRVPTGTATAMLGAPLLLWLLPHLKPELPDRIGPHHRASRPWLLIVSGAAGLIVASWLALDLVRNFDGWHFDARNDLALLLNLRAPRIAAALSAGAMLAIAGALMQRFTGNVMASPEALGITSGASLCALLLLLAAPSASSGAMLLAASTGAFVTLIAMLALGHRSAFSPQRTLLTGVALGTCVNAITSFLMADGDQRLRSAISWLSGSTYRVDASQAIFAGIILSFVLLTLPLLKRWLEILPLGEISTQSVGVNIKSSRLFLLLLAAVLTGTATLLVGPLSFVGLMAPHMARMLGLQRAMNQLLGAAICGALIMVAADWLGRNLIFPSQIPAGLLATFVGGPYFMWLMRKQTV